MDHVRLIDSLRGVAAALVLVSHVAFWTGAANIDLVGGFLARGDSGVAVFFAISAFLLLTPAYRVAMNPEGSGLRPWGSYFARRAARILPAYWFALAGVLLVGFLATTPDGVGSVRKVLIHIFLGQALFAEQYQGFSQTWSLTTEVTFYLLVPVFSWLIVRTARNQAATIRWSHALNRATYALIFIAILGPISQAIALGLSQAGYLKASAALGTSALGHASWFAAGAFIALMLQARQHDEFDSLTTPVARTMRWLLDQSRSTLLLTALAVFVLAATDLAGPRNLSQPEMADVIIKEALYAALAFFLLLAAVKPVASGTILDSYAASDLNRWIGNTSYGVFLWHLVVLQVVFLINDATLFNAHFGWTLQLVVTVTLVLASLSWYFVEKPILTRVRRRTTSAREQAR